MIETLIGKMIIFLEKVTKYDASSFPGKVILKISPNYLRKIKYPKLIIMVTGSSGKGSTAKLIKDVLSLNNYTVCNNENGSNLIYGITTTIIKNTKFNKVNKDALVLEVDERSLKYVTKYIKPNYLIINNITRDQPPRQGSFEEVFNEINKGLKTDTVIINGDDPLLRKYALINKDKKFITYSINKNKYSFDKIDDIKDTVYCPNCNNKLLYDYYHYGSIGKYTCDKCNFSNNKNDYEISKIDYNNKSITINNKYDLKTDNLSLFNLYNLLTTFTMCDLLKIDRNKIINSIEKQSINDKIFEEFSVNNRKYTVLNCKAENNVTYNLSLIYTNMDKEKKTIVLGLNEISRRYNHYDLSWLYDIYFELLNDNNVDKVIVAGPYRYDLAVRIKYTNIKEKDIIILDDLSNIKEVIEKQTKGNVYGILNFDYVKPFINNIRKDDKNGD